MVLNRMELQNLCQPGHTLLWLEDAHIDHVTHVKILKQRLVLTLNNGTQRLVCYDRYIRTKVGIQFWQKNHAGVLYALHQTGPKGPESRG